MVAVVVIISGQVLIMFVGVIFYLINRWRCKRGLRPVGYGSKATCNDMVVKEDSFYRYPHKETSHE